MLDSALEPSYNLSKKTVITAMDTEIDSSHGKWFNPPDYGPANCQGITFQSMWNFPDFFPEMIKSLSIDE